MEVPQSITLTISLGQGMPQSITGALLRLVNTLETTIHETNGNVSVTCTQQWDLEDFVRSTDLALFLMSKGDQPQTARGYAERTFSAVISHCKDKLLLVCTNCGLRYGACRCQNHNGFFNEGEWVYYSRSGGWQVSLESLLSLTDEHLQGLSRQSGDRIRNYIECLRLERSNE